MTNGGFNGFPAAAVDPRYLPKATSFPVGYLRSGHYYWCNSPSSSSTSAVLNNNTLRMSPWLVPNPVRITSIGASVTSAGDSGSKFRLGIFADDGTGYPGNLVIDAGQIAGDSNTVQELAINQQLPAGLYWVGGAIQSAPSVLPTITTATSPTPAVNVPSGTTTPTASQTFLGYSATASGALPAVFPTSVSPTGIIPRVFVKVA